MRCCLLSNGVKESMEKYIEALKAAMENGELAEVYSDPEDTDRFGAGYVIAMDEDSVVQRHIHPSGCPDGYSWRSLDQIYRVNVRTRYLESLKMLMEPDHLPVLAPEGDEALGAQLLRYAMEHELVVQIELHGSGSWNLMGLVRNVDEGVTVEMLNVEGEADGIAVVRLEDITEISCGDEYAVKIGRLYRCRCEKE